MISKLSKLIHHGQRGFTLIEILVAVAITAVISTGIAMTISQLFTVSIADKNRMEAVKQLENALHYINRDAESSWTNLIPQTGSNNTPFASTVLHNDCIAGDTSITVTSTTNLPLAGQVALGIGSKTELVTYIAISGSSLIVITPGVKFDQLANEPVSTLALHWDDWNIANSLKTYYDTIYTLVLSGDISTLQRIETVTIESGQSTQQITQVAKYINPSVANSFFTYDGTELIVTLEATLSGYKSATESRTLHIKPRIAK